MDNAWILILTSLASGLIGAVLTFVVQILSKKKETKVEMFSILMSHRYQIYDQENVDVLNRIDIIFYRHKNVIDAFKNFLDATNKKPFDKSVEEEITDKYLKLLEEMAKSLHLKKISWDKIKQFYFPTGLSTKIIEEEELRKAQIENMKGNVNNNVANSNNTALGMQFLVEMMKQPNGSEIVAQLIEKFAPKK